MQTDKIRRLLPISGVIGSLLLAAGLFASPNIDQLSATNQAEVIGAYQDNQTALIVTGFPLTLLAVLFLIPLLTELRATLRSNEAGEAVYSTLVTIGGTILATSMLLMGMFQTAVAEAVDSKLSTDSLLALAAINDQSWMPWLVGMAVLLLAVGIGGLRTLALPKALSWVSIVLGALCVTGIGGIAVFMVSPLWFLATSVVLLRAQRAEQPNQSRKTAEPVPAAG
ncbi:MAG: hypothetical protein JHD02_05190 [Thermoleophilaceae bacterium]|nr:hypothetical protein [Thermoleophilaceae bacterium]